MQESIRSSPQPRNAPGRDQTGGEQLASTGHWSLTCHGHALGPSVEELALAVTGTDPTANWQHLASLAISRSGSDNDLAGSSHVSGSGSGHWQPRPVQATQPVEAPATE
ncbi:hypothetical protein E4U43_000490 [Claviceps pusilla]|uniref:Uncharacterized protein n=1 Tax=Claviceps pusilla TaxID=123648 RepID=A0A9P7N9W4_9HYPO|nr:hypothetical protein E4U43_000490 [Claviceps pusilla]